MRKSLPVASNSPRRRLLQPDLASVRDTKAEIQDIGRADQGRDAYAATLKVLRSSGWTRSRNSLRGERGRSTLVIAKNSAGVVAAPR